MISSPEWVPAHVVEILQTIESVQRTPEAKDIVSRLATDSRMRVVWTELLKRDRKSNKYFHSARSRKNSGEFSDEQNQFDAIGELLRIAVSATRDQVVVSKPKQIASSQEGLLLRAAWLQALASELEPVMAIGQLGIAKPGKELKRKHLVALRYVAEWLVGLSGALRTPDDPLMVLKDRGNPFARAVQILLANLCEKLFGERLDGTMAIIASVAVGVAASKRASRSALSPSKSRKKAQTSKPRKGGT